MGTILKRHSRLIALLSLLALPVFGTTWAQSSGKVAASSPIQPFAYREDYASVEYGPGKFNTVWVQENQLKSFSIIEHLVQRKNKTADEEIFHFDREGRVIYQRYWEADMQRGTEKHFTFGESFFPLTRYSVWKGDTTSKSYYYVLNSRGWPAKQYSRAKAPQDSTLYFYNQAGRLIRRLHQDRRQPHTASPAPTVIDLTYDEEGRLIQQVWSKAYLGLNAHTLDIAHTDTNLVPFQIEKRIYENGRWVGEIRGSRSTRQDSPDSEVKLTDIPVTAIRYKLNERGLYAGHTTPFDSKPGTTLEYQHHYVYDAAGLLDYIDTFEVYTKKKKTSRIHYMRTDYSYERW